jgi:hypothetical protein
MEWNFESLQRLIDDEVNETSNLEFKASDSLLTRREQRANGAHPNDPSLKDNFAEASKDVSAMANANGGHIIYGIRENDANRADAFDSGYSPSAKKIAWLEEVFAKHIIPPINNIKIYPIRLLNGTNEVYVVEVPAATSNAPHQSSDKHYYQRVNARNVQLADCQIRDLMRRDTSADLFITASNLNGNWDYNATGQEPKLRFTLQIAVGNNANTPAMYAVFFLFIDSRLTIENITEWHKTDNVNQKDHVIFHRYQRNWSIPASMPLFKDCPLSLMESSVCYQALPNDRGSFQFPFFWEIHTIGSGKKSGNGSLDFPAMELPFRT